MGLYSRDYGRDDFGQETPWDRAQRQRSQGPRSFVVSVIVVTAVIWFLQLLFRVDMTDETGAVVRDQLGGVAQRNVLTEWLAVTEQTLTRPYKIWQTLTYGFIHSERSPLHLIFNMIGVYVFGSTIERTRGRWFFLKFYLLAIIFGGLIGAVTDLLLYQGNALILGASGGVVALSVYYAFHYPNNILLLMGVIPVKAWILVCVFVGFDLLNFGGELSGRGGSGTAVTVHLAGAAFAVMAFYGRWTLDRFDPQLLREAPERWRRRANRARLKVHDPDRKLQREEDEADRILEKIHRSGEASLTSAERKTLQRYSQRKRQARG